MSLYSYEEICKGCKHSKFINNRFVECTIKQEDNVNALHGTCDKKEIGTKDRYHYIGGTFSLHHNQDYNAPDFGILEDGTLAQKIAEILVRELKDFGVGEVEIDFDESVLVRLKEVKNNLK